jgi:sulfhydrogenase subunit gamma (sulfur reductase)
MSMANHATFGTKAVPIQTSGKPIVSPFKPRLLRIITARDETPDVRTLQLQPIDNGERLQWAAGQFGEYSVIGVGEAVFTIANAPTRPDYLECSFRAVGKVTNALRNLSIGQLVGFRGPYGNRFPVEQWKGKNLVFIGGGIGMAALRPALQWVLDNRRDYGEVVLLNGARTPADLCYQEEMTSWAALPNVRVVRTVDAVDDHAQWRGEVGLLPQVFERLKLAPHGRVVIACGPPIMLRFLFVSLEKLGYSPEQVVTTLENRMKCGLGLCGRCNVGRHFVCVDGPVFTWAQLKTMPNE